MTTKHKQPDPFDCETLLVIDKRIDASEAEGIRDRWEFGQRMLAARGGKKRLPNGYLAELVTRTGKSQSELSYRIRFAETYPTEVELSNVLESYTSWHELVENLYATSPVARMQRLTVEIRAGVSELETLIAQARDGQIWKPLGYASWDDYCDAKFGHLFVQLLQRDGA